MAGRPSLLSLSGLDEGLARVESELREAVRADEEFLTELASHLVLAGGKRLRPALCLAAAAVAHPDSAPTDAEVRAGVAVELVHLGSLYHDDVMDDADTRRTVESVNARWGNLRAILAGDFLLARASELAATLGTEVAGLLAATIGRLCEGQVRELQQAFDADRTQQQYLQAITGKTAALFSCACRTGALVAGLERAHVEALTEFGNSFGMAFQIVDDVLDVVATEEQLGKPAGHDMVEGVYTLPVILMLAGDEGDDLRRLLGRPLDESGRDRARLLLRSNGAIAASLAVAEGYARRAVDALSPLPSNEALTALAGAPHHLLASVPVPA